MELPNEAFFFFLATVAMITVKMYFTHLHSSSCQENIFLYSCNLLVHNSENGVKQIKDTQENLSQSCILCQLLRTKTLASGSKCIQHFSLFLPLFALYLLSGCDLFNMSSPFLNFLDVKFRYFVLQSP